MLEKEPMVTADLKITRSKKIKLREIGKKHGFGTLQKYFEAVVDLIISKGGI